MMNRMNAMGGINGMTVGAVTISGGVGLVEFQREVPTSTIAAQTAMQASSLAAQAVERVKILSAETLANAHITLRELKTKIASTVGAKLPSFKQLMEMESPVVAEREVSGAVVSVYENGFAVYRRDEAHTVIAVDRCGGYRYDFVDGDADVKDKMYIPAEVFEEEEWTVRLVMEGEKRLESNQARDAGRNETTVSESSEEGLHTAVMVDFLKEENQEILADLELKRLYAAINKLTERQQEVIQLYYFKGMTQQEIAEELGMARRSVGNCLEGALKKIKKVF